MREIRVVCDRISEDAVAELFSYVLLVVSQDDAELVAFVSQEINEEAWT